jgi:hypothetical protein
VKLKAVVLAVLIGALVALSTYSCQSTDEPTAVDNQASSTATAAPTSTTPATTTTQTPASTGEKTDTDLAEDAARQALTAMWSWQPATDTSSADALARARPWFTDDLAATTTSTEQPERGPGWQWDQWRTDKARIVADVTLGCSGCPPDEADRIYRVATITQTVVTPDGTVTALDEPITMWIKVIRQSNTWRVAEFHY